MSVDTEQAGKDRVIGHGNEDYEHVMARIEAIARLRVPELMLPTRVTLIQGDRVAVSESLPEHETLDAMLASRGPLRAGEAVWLGMGVANALAALHKAGLVHGAIGPAAVGVTSAGVGLARVADGGVRPADDADRPSQSGDIAALGAVLAGAVRDQDGARLRAWTDPMTHPDPAGRPSAAMVARALSSCAPPEQMDPGQVSVAGALRRAINGRTAGGGRAMGAVVELPDARWWRMRVAARSWLVRGAVTVAILGLVTVGGVVIAQAVGSSGTGPSEGSVAAADVPVPEAEVITRHEPLPSPVDAATRATLARFDAIAAGDAEALVATTAPGSEARAQAEALAAQLATGAFASEGVVGVVDSAALVRLAAPDGAGGAPAAQVRVSYTLGDHALIRDGVREQYDAYQQTVDLLLAWDGTGDWKVRSVAEVAG